VTLKELVFKEIAQDFMSSLIIAFIFITGFPVKESVYMELPGNFKTFSWNCQ